MTVGELRASMSNQEYVEWGVFLGRRAQRIQLEQERAKWTR